MPNDREDILSQPSISETWTENTAKFHSSTFQGPSKYFCCAGCMFYQKLHVRSVLSAGEAAIVSTNISMNLNFNGFCCNGI